MKSLPASPRGVGDEHLDADQAGRREGVRHLGAAELGRGFTERPFVRERAASRP